MPKRKEPELTPEEQYERFEEAAKKDSVTQEKEFERACRHVTQSLPPRKRPDAIALRPE